MITISETARSTHRRWVYPGGTLVSALIVIALAATWDRPANGQTQPVGPLVADFLLGTGGALDSTGAGARALATGGAGYTITTAPACFDIWCGNLLATAPVLLAAYKRYYSSDTAQKTAPQAGQSTYWYNSGGAYFRVVYWDNYDNLAGNFYLGVPWGCFVSWPIGPGPRYYIDIVGTPTWLWWWPDGQSHGCGPCVTAPLSAIDAIASCARIGPNNTAAVNPWGTPTQQDANTWVQTQIDGGHWADVVKPALDAVIRPALTWQDLANLGIARIGITVAIDAGHGRLCSLANQPTTGATGPYPPGLSEDDLVLDIAQKVATDLSQRGYRVIQTRPDTCYVTQAYRVVRAWADPIGPADIFVSIHLNSACTKTTTGTVVCYPSTNGTEVWIDPGFGGTSVRSSSLAVGIAASQHQSLNLAFTPRGASTVPGLKWSGFDSPWVLPNKIFVLLSTGWYGMPSALSEVAFLSNPAQEQLLVSDPYRLQAALAISGAITQFFGPR